jgi:hypothetical protein
MNLIMPCTEAHPASGKEVMTVDDSEVNVSCVSVNNTSDLKERMGNDE